MPQKQNDSTQTTPVPYHAWYSHKQRIIRSNTNCLRLDRRNAITCHAPGSIYWKDRHGTLVEVTVVSKTSNHGCNTATLDDLEYRGIVYSYAGVCQP